MCIPVLWYCTANDGRHKGSCIMCTDLQKCNKEFILFLFNIVSRWDRLLILRDFNVHLCCLSKPLAKEFLCLSESLNLSWLVFSPTHNLGHTVDLVLSHGFPIINLRVIDAAISDHLPIVFESVGVSCSQSVSYSRFIQPSTAGLFPEYYRANFVDAVFFEKSNMVEVFTKSCSVLINSVAPPKPRKAKGKGTAQPWWNDNTLSLRQEGRKSERKWKRDAPRLVRMFNCMLKQLPKFSERG